MVKAFLDFQSEVDNDQQNRNIFFIRKLIRRLQPSAYSILHSIIDHVARILEGELQQPVWDIAGILALCLTGVDQARCRLLTYLILNHRISIFSIRQSPNGQETSAAAESWYTFYGLTEKAIQSKKKHEINRQIAIHEIVGNVHRTVQKLDCLQSQHKYPALNALPNSRNKKESLQLLFQIADTLRSSHAWLLRQLQNCQKEEGPWIIDFSQNFRYWFWQWKVRHVDYVKQMYLARDTITAITSTHTPTSAPRQTAILECLKSPIVSIPQYSILLTCVFDNMQDIPGARPIQLTQTAEQVEYSNLGRAIEELEPTVFFCNVFLHNKLPRLLGDREHNLIGDIISFRPERKILNKGSLLMAKTKTAYKVIEAVEGILYSDFFVVAHRRWNQGGKSETIDTTVDYLIKYNVSICHSQHSLYSILTP